MLHNTLCSREKTQLPLRDYGREAEFRLEWLAIVRREIRSVMTRLQNAKNQLIEALAALESAASHATKVSKETNAVASPSQMGAQTVVGTDLSTLVDEVSIIEAKLSQAMTMIATVESGAFRPRTVNDGDTQ